ncbi:hypothetical protein [Plasmodium yoelii yoelii]|uniref:Uncharacterized protein n=2 Tax=Plasmodium yoelii yoelii TaxID=73239 RepID=A0AAE9X187_PLAYO|nr:hypothetical protein [Plasmodium yoelii yoelii]WBY60077.1 hypothetical protein Py17XNL_001303234 [Plasmodium yoelii yoelii]
MSHLEFLHKFVISHSNNFLQSFYAVVESSQIECLECPIEKTGIDNFLIKIYIDNIVSQKKRNKKKLHKYNVQYL